jgi:hypothetical protein
MDVFTAGILETAITGVCSLGAFGIIAYIVVTGKRNKLRERELAIQEREVAVKEQEMLYQREKLALMHDAMDKESFAKLLKE